MQQSQHNSAADQVVGGDFDFDDWRELYQRDPQAFEARRLAWINELIDSAPQDQQRRLRGLMFQIDAQRQLASNPLDACIRVSSMMWERFADLKEHLNGMANPRSGEGQQTELRLVDSAQVLSFRGRE
jgi:hypothetical protein